ncbi:MAG: nitronate monooxygenase [Kofleriaceae bacterium]|nr:nitronate monooxygenase [Kofleriaceae bacterium]MCB9573841.1 nitronate monooxygenase [Kofleriaceae bacterium]
MSSPLAEELGLEVPIFAFSKAPEVVAAVSRAGGMGVLGAVAYTVDQLREGLDFIEAHVDGKPYGVDVVMPAKYEGAGQTGGAAQLGSMLEQMIPARHKAFIEELLTRHEVPPLPEGTDAWHHLLAWTEETTRPQVDLVLELAKTRPIKLLANALGPPPRDIVDRAHAAGLKVAALTGRVEHARKHVANGVDVIVAQGTEAGGHCGEISTMVLVPEIVDAVGKTPVLAAGGIGCGRQVAAAMALGAQGAWTGSIWLTAEESDVIPLLKDKLVRAGSRDTVRSRALTGKPARQLRTAWSDAWDDPKGPGPLAMPMQFMATADATSRIFRYAGQPGTRAEELLTSPVGQIVGRMDAVRPVATIMDDLVRELHETIARLNP